MVRQQTVTTERLARFNRNVEILYRHHLGDTMEGIAKSYGLERLQIQRIISRPNLKLVMALKNKIQHEGRVMSRTLDHG